MSIGNFLSQINSAAGLARTNRYRVLINANGVVQNNTSIFSQAVTYDSNLERRLTLFCDKAELPGRAFATSDIRHYGPTYKQPYQSEYEDIALQFLVGNDMVEKYFFDAWMSSIEDPSTQNFNFFKNYVTDIIIQQFSDVPWEDIQGTVENDDDSLISYQVKLYDAWPIGMGQLFLDYSNENMPHRLNIAFAYRRWVDNAYDTESGSAVSNGSITRLKGSGAITRKPTQ